MINERLRSSVLNKLSTKAALIIADSYMERIRVFVNDVIQNPDLVDTQNVLPSDNKAMSAAAILFIRAALLGIAHSTKKNEFADTDTDDDIEKLPFEEALDYLSKKSPIDRDEYYRLSDRLRFRAFTASRIADGDMLTRVKKLLAKNIKDGDSLNDFLKKIDLNFTRELGLGEGGGWYWETVYRTNVQTAYNVGRAIGFDAVPPAALELVGIGDSRQTDICRSLTQPPVRRPYGDPFWQVHWPPFHFNCRTTIRGIYDTDELIETPYTGISDAEAEKGFGTYPLESDAWWDETRDQKVRARRYRIQGEIDKARQELTKKDVFAEKVKEAIAGAKSEKDTTALGALVIKQAEREGVDYFEVMKRVKEFGTNQSIPFMSGSHALAKRAVQDALRYYPKTAIDRSVAASRNHGLLVRKAGGTSPRGRYSHDTSRIIGGTMRYYSELVIDGGRGTPIHELAHRMEQLNPWIVEMEKQFYERRTKGEELRPLRELTGLGYPLNEVARKDRFLSPYMGRDYGGYAYELFSTGMEQILFGKYADRGSDRDFESFVIGILMRL